MIGRIREPDLRERNNKSQTPSSREIPNFKFQNLSQACCLGAWELLWGLEFGVWRFDWLPGLPLSPLLRRGERQNRHRRRAPQCWILSSELPARTDSFT